MAVDSRAFEIFGDALGSSALTRGNEENNNSIVGASQTPQFLIKCSVFFDSLIDGATDDTAPCLWVETGSSRFTTYDSTDEVFGNGRIVAKAPIVCMKYGSWGPLLQQYMMEGTMVQDIIIQRISSAASTNVVLQETTYSTCLINSYEQRGDKIVFSFSYLQIMDVSKSIKPDGTNKGNFGFQFNYGSLKLEEKK